MTIIKAGDEEFAHQKELFQQFARSYQSQWGELPAPFEVWLGAMAVARVRERVMANELEPSATEREAFETWYRNEYPGSEVRVQNLIGTYTKSYVNWCATGWFARAYASPWIPVSERLPKDGQLVVVSTRPCAMPSPYDCELKVWPAEWNAEHQTFVAGRYPSAGWFEKDEVTHWLPLPDAPKE